MIQSKYLISIAITSLAVIWPFLASWLAAYQVIPGNTEQLTRWLCLPVAVLGALYCLNEALTTPVKPLKIIIAILIPVCAATAVFQARKYSDQMFAFWIMKRVSPAEWQEMALSVHRISRKAGSAGQSMVAPADLPRDLPMLGRAEKCWGIDGIMDVGDGHFGGRLIFGDRNRKWGLLVGPEEFLNYFSWKKFRYIPVATNAVFFIGPDW